MVINKFDLTAGGYFRLIRVDQAITHLNQKHHLAEVL